VIADYLLSTPRLDDPYPYYRLLRDEEPAHYSAVEDLWVISRFDDCLEVFSNWRLWSSEQRGNLLNDPPERIGKTLGTTDPPRHTTARQLVNKAFTPRRVADLEPVIRDLARRLAVTSAAQGRVEYVHEVAAPLTAFVLGALFGLGESEVLELRPALDDFFTRETPGPGAAPPHVAAMASLRKALDDLVEARRRCPGTDLVSAMIAAEEEGARLSHEQVVVTTMTFLTAGFESVNNLLTNVANVLATMPDVLAAVRNDLELVSQLVEETMRWDAAAQGFVRSPTEDVVLHGRTIPAGAQVLVHIGSANRDERQFADPDRFDLGRSMKRHLGLGHGTHFCVGAPLGRQLARISIEELLRVSTCFEADFRAAERVKTPNFRGFMRLDVSLRG
jgi:cytochrome P450